MRPSDGFLSLAGILVAVALGLGAHSLHTVREDGDRIASTARLVGELGLTDLGLFPEANYTRHLSQTDLHTPFQDYPLSVEHFPAGALVPPPPHLKASDARVD